MIFAIHSVEIALKLSNINERGDLLVLSLHFFFLFSLFRCLVDVAKFPILDIFFHSFSMIRFKF